MTRKQAIRLVIQYLNESPALDENLCKAKSILQEMLNGIPGKIWDDATIRQAIERFIQENGRPPTVKELDSVEYLPPHPSVCQQYKMTAGKWLNENYPSNMPNWRFRYKQFSKEDFQKLFIDEYNSILPVSSLDYNRRRRKATPSWQLIAKMLSVTTWRELKNLCSDKLQSIRPGVCEFSVISQILN